MREQHTLLDELLEQVTVSVFFFSLFSCVSLCVCVCWGGGGGGGGGGHLFSNKSLLNCLVSDA